MGVNSIHVPKTISEFLTEISMINDMSERCSKLNDYVQMLEDEMRKIKGLKRELPLCMHLLSDAIERLKMEAMECRGRDVVGLITEQFLPSKANCEEDKGAKMISNCNEKKNWMSSAQLWTHDSYALDLNSINIEEEDGFAIEKASQKCNFREREREYVGFKGDRCGMVRKEKSGQNSCDLSLRIDQTKPRTQLLQPLQPLQPKKPRRCWSPELHRRFIYALQQLGGVQEATPKHIRQLMQVDGLTNDEVKSHLQKYRIHVRRLEACATDPANGLWLAWKHQKRNSKLNIISESQEFGKGYISSTATSSIEEEVIIHK